ncbi:hypothetical protein K504DRAFT_384129 [Pleomassaria siparia CBS 279.74]|uniref:Uncharacterized protein n=1 Tax=Pleomassaria siparia CBS 279.74 TaxID=1314801 RepID=A0A6G1K3H2_9PLEO|nr:hypothetical protein K504DRAFT_384129 [Pleomassaria siparia CBS 279.74]
MNTARGLPQSSDKRELFARLGLTEEVHRRMLDAAETRDRISSNVANATPYTHNDPNRVQPPYKWDQITETARHGAQLQMATNANDSTRPFYDQGRLSIQVSQGNWVQENWVARWYLWHSFRNRDNRNKTQREPEQHNHRRGRFSGAIATEQTQKMKLTYPGYQAPQRTHYDPVREHYR